MKKILLLAVISIIGFGRSIAQNDKNVVVDANAEVRKTSGTFSSIELSGAIDLYLSQGTEDAVAISASSDEIKARIRTEVKGTTLHIYFDGKGLNWKTWGNNKMKAYVTFRKLSRIEASGACNIRATEVIRGEDLSIELSGASDFAGEVAFTKIKLDLSGASNVKLSGTAVSTSIEASGACTVRGYDLKTDNCKIDASGASNIYITVNKEMNAGASGGSNISYKGSGVIRDISTSGGASIKRRQDE